MEASEVAHEAPVSSSARLPKVPATTTPPDEATLAAEVRILPDEILARSRTHPHEIALSEERISPPPREVAGPIDVERGDEVVVVAGKEARERLVLPEDVERARQSYDVPAIVEELKQAFRNVGRHIIGREELLTQTLYSILTREHQLIFSRAGMAKSLYAASVFGQFRDAHTFSMQLTKGTTEEGLVGAINIEELKKGNIVHNVKGSIVEARLAFLDEIFDANDVALRSLLGILNERMFVKGKQQVEAVLHSAIATSNYMRSNDVTEAVIDRFPFRATLLPDAEMYQALKIDEAYEEKTGRAAIPPIDRRIDMDKIDYLSDIIEGRVPGKEIGAPRHVLFLKNAVITEFVRLENERRKADGKPELYVSPRTIAKTRDILNAAALLRGRSEIAVSDLPDLKYMVTTLGDEGQAASFDQALKKVGSGVSRSDRKIVDFLMQVDDLLHETLVRRERGESFEPTFLEKVKIFFGLTSIGHLTFGGVKRVVEQSEPEHPLVKELKASVLERIENEKCRFDGKQRNVLF